MFTGPFCVVCVCVVYGVVYDVCSQVLFVWCVWCVLCMVWCMMYVHRSFLCGVCVLCMVWCMMYVHRSFLCGVCVCVLCMVRCMMYVHRSFLCGVCMCVVYGVVYDVYSQVLFVWCVCLLCMVWRMMCVHRSLASMVEYVGTAELVRTRSELNSIEMVSFCVSHGARGMVGSYDDWFVSNSQLESCVPFQLCNCVLFQLQRLTFFFFYLKLRVKTILISVIIPHFPCAKQSSNCVCLCVPGVCVCVFPVCVLVCSQCVCSQCVWCVCVLYVSDLCVYLNNGIGKFLLPLFFTVKITLAVFMEFSSCSNI